MVMSSDQNAGQRHNMKTHNISFERVKQFKYFGTLTEQNYIQEEIMSRLQSWNACFSAESFVCQSAIQKHNA